MLFRSIQTILNSPNPQSAITGLGLSGNAANAAQSLVNDWQARFSGNQARIKQGLAPLDPATYIQYEQTYKQLLSSAGVANNSPLMDTNYIGQLIGADVSAAEMQMRVNAAQNVIQNESLSEDDKMIQFKLSFEKIRQINIDIVIDGIDSITTEEGVVVSDRKMIEEFLDQCSRQVYDNIKKSMEELVTSFKLKIGRAHV